MVVAQRNVELAAEMMALAGEVDTHRKEDIQDKASRQEVEKLEASVRVSRQRWRIMKGTASATVVGSGVDWARDERLLGIVLEGEDEDG